MLLHSKGKDSGTTNYRSCTQGALNESLFLTGLLGRERHANVAPTNPPGHSAAGRPWGGRWKQKGPPCGGLPTEGLWAPTGKWEEPRLDSGLKNKERGQTLDVNTLELQWAGLLGHWALVTTTGGLETPISLPKNTQAALPTHLKFFP